MNSELIKAIDEAIDYVNEDVTPNQQTTLLGIINKIDGDNNKYPSLDDFKKNPWPKLDNKWDTLAKEITNTQINANITNAVLKVTGATKNGTAVPDAESYIVFDSNTQSATLTTKDKASAVDNGWLGNKLLGKNVYKWLKNNPRNEQDGYQFDGANVQVEKSTTNKVEKNQQLDYSVLAEFYYNIFNNDQWNRVPRYWQTVIINDLFKNKSLISSLPLQFIDKAQSIQFNGKDLLEILKDEKISELVYFIVIQEQAISIGTLDDDTIYKSFILSSVLYNCFDRLDTRDALKLIEEFTNIKQYYGSMKQSIKDIIAGEDEDAKAEALAENAIMIKNGQLAENPFIKWAALSPEERSTYLESEGSIKAIELKARFAYKAVTQDELKRILTIIMDTSKDAELNWYLVINSNKYLLKTNNKTLTLADTKNPIKFFEDAKVKIVFAAERSAEDAESRIAIKEIKQGTLELNDSADPKIIAVDYFDLDTTDNLILVKKGKGFIATKISATFEGAGRDQKITKIVIGDNIKPLNEKDKNKKTDNDEDEEDNDNEPNKEKENKNGITEEQARDAIKKYLYTQPLDIFKGTGKQKKVDDFIDSQTFNGKSLSTRYKAIINTIIKEIQRDPKLYGYNKELNKITRLDGTSMLDALIDILNGNMAEAIATKQANEIGQNIPGIRVDKDNIKAPEVSAQTIANKLDNISAILKQDTTNGTDKTSKDVINKVGKGDLAEIISWFNDRYSNGKKVNVDSTASSPKPTNNVMGTRRKPMGRK